MFYNFYQWNWPLSGAVEQEIHLLDKAGDPETEATILREVTSYGQQIGILSEIVESLAQKVDLPECRKAIAQLQTINREIERRKKPGRAQARKQLQQLLELYPDLALT